MKYRFKEENTFDVRKAESAKIRSKYPDRIPVIIQKSPSSTIQEIEKEKFLVPSDLSVAQFMYIIRKNLQLPPERALFIFIDKVLPTTSATMGAVYEEHQDEDGFLYTAYKQRKAESSKIRSKYPERIPVIVEKAPNSHVPDIDKRKFLVPNDISVAQFMWIIRKRIQLPSEKALFLFVGKVLPQSSASMGQIYEEHRDEDGFLYIAYSGENTFGC